VTDLLGEGLRAVGTRSPLAYPFVFAAGAVTSIGPCAAPRYIAVAALAQTARRPWTIVAAFCAGLIGAYVALGLGASAVASLWSASAMTYAAFAAVLAAGGIVTLMRADGRAACSHDGAARARRVSAGGTFLLGAASAFVVSPCCTPVVAGIAGLTMTSGRAADGVTLLAAFACGHALPVVAAGALGTRLSGALRSAATSQAPAIVAGSLMLALAAYYGTLA
jgi:cytochrome c biogenesis protein CcdA